MSDSTKDNLREEVATVLVQMENLQQKVFDMARRAKQDKNKRMLDDVFIQLLIPIGKLRKALGGEKK